MANVGMSFTVPEEDDKYIRWLINNGKFAGISDVVRAAIRVFQDSRNDKNDFLRSIEKDRLTNRK